MVYVVIYLVHYIYYILYSILYCFLYYSTILQCISKSNLLNFILLLISRIRHARTCTTLPVSLTLFLLSRSCLFQPPKAKITLVTFFYSALVAAAAAAIVVKHFTVTCCCSCFSALFRGIEFSSVQFSSVSSSFI